MDNHNIVKKILFRAESPFTNLTALLIGQLYYRKMYKILLVDALLYDGFQEKAIKFGFYDEIHVINVTDRSIRKVEESVDDFLSTHQDIDEYFMNTFSDCYSLMIAYRLKGKAVLNVFPEGGTYANLSWTLKYITSCGICATDSERAIFFKKYPISLDLFDYLWTFDKNSSIKTEGIKTKYINIETFRKQEWCTDVINKLNFIFDCEVFPEFDICFIDEHTMIEDNLLFLEAEKRTLDILFDALKNKEILIKPHPPRKMLPYVRARYRNYKNSQILECSDLPWELILLNMLIRKEKKEINIIMPIFGGTCFMTTVALLPKDYKCNILSLGKLYSEHYDHYWVKAGEKTNDYFWRIADKENVRLFLPKDYNELIEMSRDFAGGVCNDVEPLPPVLPNDYFFKVGNLVAKSLICSEGQFVSQTYFSFLHQNSIVTFDIEKNILIDGFWWIASTSYIFSGVFNAKVAIYNELDNCLEYNICKGENLLVFNKKKVFCRVDYRGYCKKIVITGEFKRGKAYCELYNEYFAKAWKGEFWERWYIIVKQGKVGKYISACGYCEIWVYGKSNIAYSIEEELLKSMVKCRHVVSYIGNNIMNDNDILLNDLKDNTEIPDVLVITPMQDYDLILFSLPDRFRKISYGLNEFLDRIIEIE